MNSDSEKAYLVLSDGTVFEGRSFGAPGDSVGELVFTTGMCGYIETLTDPSYGGQIILQTFPLIGNYGMIEEDFEGNCAARGYVVREFCETPSNFRCDYGLDAFLKRNSIPGICGVDTRELTRIIREHGVMRAQLFDSLSGGEKTRVNLARLILEDTDILLLDEPTNHLDLHATEWLEEYILHFRGTVLAISHDRYFLDVAWLSGPAGLQ